MAARKGKSLWIYYALRRRLAEGKPVIWYYNERRYLFVDAGVFAVPDRFPCSQFNPFIWTLVDSDEVEDGVPTFLVQKGSMHFVIFTTSPRRKRWSRLHKTTSFARVIMNPWTINEILQA